MVIVTDQPTRERKPTKGDNSARVCSFYRSRVCAMSAAAISISTKPPCPISPGLEGFRRRLLRQLVRCSVTSEVAVPMGRGGGDSDGSPAGRISVDCVVVGGGINGLCTAQALATRHASAVSEILVTEARDRVGGNIITMERDGYLWEEGPNSFQPSDAVLSMAVCLLLDTFYVLVSIFFIYRN